MTDSVCALLHPQQNLFSFAFSSRHRRSLLPYNSTESLSTTNKELTRSQRLYCGVQSYKSVSEGNQFIYRPKLERKKGIPRNRSPVAHRPSYRPSSTTVPGVLPHKTVGRPKTADQWCIQMLHKTNKQAICLQPQEVTWTE